MVLRHRLVVHLLLLIVLVAASGSRAEECIDDCVPVGQWQVNLGVGFGWRANPLRDGTDSPMFVLPELSYYGERFFLKNLEMGWTLFENRQHQFSLLLTPSSDQMHFNRWDPYNFVDANRAGSGPSGGNSAPVYEHVNFRSNDSQLGSSSSSVPATEGPPIDGDPKLSDVTYIRVNDQQVTDTAVDGRESVSLVQNSVGDTWDLVGLNSGDRVGIARNDPNSQQPVYEEYIYDGANLNPAQETIWQPPEAPLVAGTGAVDVHSVKTRRTAALTGFEYVFSGSHFDLHSQLLHDISGVHDGDELRLAIIVPWEMSSSRWAFTFGSSYKSREILDYYYGIRAADTASGTTLFEVDSGGLAYMLRLDWQKPLTKKWSLRGMVQYNRLPSQIMDSPLVVNRATASFFFGGVYHF